METLLSLTLSGSALALLLLLLKKLLGGRLSSTVYYYAWLLVLLRFLLPLPGLVPLGQEANSSAPSHLTAPRLPEETELPVQAELPAPAPLSELPVLTPAVPEADGQATGSFPAPSPAAAHTLSIDWRSPTLWLSLWALGQGSAFSGRWFPTCAFAVRSGQLSGSRSRLCAPFIPASRGESRRFPSVPRCKHP